MFERFTKPARAVVELAFAEAASLGGERVGAEHLLVAVAGGGGTVAPGVLARLGLGADALRADLRATGGLDGAALAAIGIDLDAVRRRVEENFGPGALGPARGKRPAFTRASKKALELSLREAIARGDRNIGPEHILLGVLRDPGDGVAPLLRRLGRTPDEVRAALSDALRAAA